MKILWKLEVKLNVKQEENIDNKEKSLWYKMGIFVSLNLMPLRIRKRINEGRLWSVCQYFKPVYYVLIIWFDIFQVILVCSSIKMVW